MTDPLSIGFLSMGDARSPSAWSGTIFHMAQALEAQGAHLGYIGPMDQKPLQADKWLAKLRQKLGGGPSTPLRTQRAARIFARQIQKATDGAAYDLLYCPAGSVLLADLPDGVPVAYSSDSTAALLHDYYPKYRKMTPGQLARLDALEARAIARADVLLYPTHWAAQSAIKDYGADPAKVHVLPYGSNLAPPARDAALAPRPDGPLELLFIGVKWERKGGAIAIDALDTLTRRGVDAHMTVIGSTPAAEFRRPNVTVIPFLDKKDPAQLQEIVDCYLKADMLILPTQQECYGIVFCEAAAHGVPSVASATGGVPDLIKDGVTGHTIPLDGDGPAYADAIEAILSAPGGLAAARLKARDDFEARLNWGAWGTQAATLMQQLR